ncbi:cellulose binding domain-containing protein [Streptomyces sp. H51]|uniref:cellulose binding domain-containing protein n=1 Tax=Streptomyces sp. H51 TaxID=3111770 RepID=UPI003B63FE1E
MTVTDTGTSTSSGWQVGWTWPGAQKVTTAWSTRLTQSGSAVTASNVDSADRRAPGKGAGAWDRRARPSACGLHAAVPSASMVMRAMWRAR